MDELRNKRKKRYFEKVVLLPGEKEWSGLTKVRCGWIEAVLVCESGRVALLWNDALGREIFAESISFGNALKRGF